MFLAISDRDIHVFGYGCQYFPLFRVGLSMFSAISNRDVFLLIWGRLVYVLGYFG